MNEELKSIKKDLFHKRKSYIITYLLWWFGGMFGLHRMYLGQWLSGAVMLLLTLSWIGIPIAGIIWLCDIVLNYSKLEYINYSPYNQENNDEIEDAVYVDIPIKEVKINTTKESVKNPNFKVRF